MTLAHRLPVVVLVDEAEASIPLILLVRKLFGVERSRRTLGISGWLRRIQSAWWAWCISGTLADRTNRRETSPWHRETSPQNHHVHLGPSGMWN